jgi:hypothetical protein
MNPQIASLIDSSLSIVVGIVVTLIGFRLLGPKPGINGKFEALHAKWLKHLKWLGPLMIVFASAQLITSAFTGGLAADGEDWKKRTIQAVQVNLSADGKLAEQEQVIATPEGFSVLIPKGYTYSKPLGTPLSLAAAYDAHGAATPAFAVSVMKLEGGLDRVVDSTKAGMVAKNKTTRFSETQVIEKGGFKLYRTAASSQQFGLPVKGGMLFFENEGKAFMLVYGTREELFDANAPIFEKIIRSFGPA